MFDLLKPLLEECFINPGSNKVNYMSLLSYKIISIHAVLGIIAIIYKKNIANAFNIPQNHHLHHWKTHPSKKIVVLSSSPDSQTEISKNDQANTKMTSQGLLFGKFMINQSQIFYRSPSNLSAAIVNLKPIIPGHVLVISTRVVPRLNQLTSDEYSDLFQTVRVVQGMIEKHYNASACNVAIQDGKAAGQSVFHVHVHILPRKDGDLERNDDVYDALEAWDPSSSGEKIIHKLKVKDDNERLPRTMEQMEEESRLYASLLKDL